MKFNNNENIIINLIKSRYNRSNCVRETSQDIPYRIVVTINEIKRH